jgi:hypothetical protein
MTLTLHETFWLPVRAAMHDRAEMVRAMCLRLASTSIQCYMRGQYRPIWRSRSSATPPRKAPGAVSDSNHQRLVLRVEIAKTTESQQRRTAEEVTLLRAGSSGSKAESAHSAGFRAIKLP